MKDVARRDLITKDVARVICFINRAYRSEEINITATKTVTFL